jgi:hypothetical protein
MTKDASIDQDQTPATSHSSQSNGGNPENGGVTTSPKMVNFGKGQFDEGDILQLLRNGQVWMVNSRRRNGLILCKSFHAEFAGPGSAVGGLFDEDCQRVIPVGDLSLVCPEDHEERQKAYLIRRQWIRLTHQLTNKDVPIQRAQSILNQFETYFDADTVSRIPDDIFASLVGVLPHTVQLARRPPGQLNVKVKA